MSNSLASNITTKLMKSFIPAFEKQRVLSKTVDSQTFKGSFNPASGSTVNVKRPHQYLAQRTAAGDISAGTDNTIISGKAVATVQNWITVPIPWTSHEEALYLDQLDEITKPAAVECVTVLETALADFMIANAALSIGTPGTPVSAWSHIARAKSLMDSLGVPGDEQYYVMNPFTNENLADAQAGLTPGSAGAMVKSAWEKAQISSKVAGLNLMASNSLSTWTSGTTADRVGALTAAPTATYLAAKDTMVQTLAYEALTAAGTLAIGDILEFTGTGSDARSYINPRTRKTIFGADGNPVKWRCVVTALSTADGTGAGTVTVAGPAIYEANGQYNNISAALTTGDVFSVLGTASVEYQPNLFYAKSAFTVAYVKIPKLHSTDTIAVTNDGIVIRCSKYANGDTNSQKIRFDLLPAFGVMNPFFAGKGFGIA